MKICEKQIMAMDGMRGMANALYKTYIVQHKRCSMKKLVQSF